MLCHVKTNKNDNDDKKDDRKAADDAYDFDADKKKIVNEMDTVINPITGITQITRITCFRMC